MATNANRKTPQKRAPRSESRTKQIVRLIKRPGDYDTMDVVTLFVPEEKLNKLPAAVQSDFMKMGLAMVEVVKAGEYDLRRGMN